MLRGTKLDLRFKSEPFQVLFYTTLTVVSVSATRTQHTLHQSIMCIGENSISNNAIQLQYQYLAHFGVPSGTQSKEIAPATIYPCV